MKLTAKQLETALNVHASTIHNYRRDGKIVADGTAMSPKGRPVLLFKVVCPALAERLKVADAK